MFRRRGFRGCAVSVLAFTAACSSFELQSNWSSYSFLSAEPSNESKTLQIACPASATTVRLDLTTHGADGQLALLLIDPAGVERHRETLQGGYRQATMRWPARERLWVLQVTPKDFTGSYGVGLSDQDGQAPVTVHVAGDVRK